MQERIASPAAENTILPNELVVFESDADSNGRIEKRRKTVENGVKHHGLRAESPVIPGERRADWRAHLQGFMDYYQPEGHVENILVERLAHISWRFRRITRYDVAVTVKHMDQTGRDMERIDSMREIFDNPRRNTQEDIDREFSVRVLPDTADIDKLIRYETHLHRQYIQTSNHLEALQSRRRGEPAPLARLDITGPP